MTNGHDAARPGAGGSPLGGGQNPGDGNAALGRAALKHRVRTITGGAVELTDEALQGSVVGAVVEGMAYCQTADARGVGPLVRWGLSHQANRLTIVAEADVAPDVARRADLLDLDIPVWSAAGPEVVPAVAGAVLTPPELPMSHRRYASVITEAGARAIDDHGMLVAEVAGLEVARVVDGDDLSIVADGAGTTHRNGTPPGPQLAVGVGQADRELQDYIHGHLDDDANLRRAIAAVVQHRKPGSAVHPLTRVARQRWLRSILLDDPSLIGLDELDPIVPLRPRTTVLGDEPSAAAGSGAIVVCSVGVDLDLLPEAVDYRDRDDPDAELIVVVPERDRQLVAGPMAELIPGLRMVSVSEPWTTG